MKSPLPPAPPPPPELPSTDEPPNSKLRRKKGLPTRVPRRPEEDEPGADYVEKLEKLGPRQGESLLAFRKRMCMIEGTRRLWVETWRRYGGNRADAARHLGIPPNNVAFELRIVGLSTQLLNDFLLGKVELA